MFLVHRRIKNKKQKYSTLLSVLYIMNDRFDDIYNLRLTDRMTGLVRRYSRIL